MATCTQPTGGPPLLGCCPTGDTTLLIRGVSAYVTFNEFLFPTFQDAIDDANQKIADVLASNDYAGVTYGYTQRHLYTWETDTWSVSENLIVPVVEFGAQNAIEQSARIEALYPTVNPFGTSYGLGAKYIIDRPETLCRLVTPDQFIIYTINACGSISVGVSYGCTAQSPSPNTLYHRIYSIPSTYPACCNEAP